MEKIVRFAGRISEWNDEKGFGFVVPNGGGERAFWKSQESQGSGLVLPHRLAQGLPLNGEKFT